MAPAREKTSSERKAHLAAIDKITDRWHAGEISTEQKRELIAKENSFWYGRQHRSSATGEVITSAGGGHGHVAPQSPPPEDEDEEIPWWQK
jgi:hypothetical protein